MNYYRFISPQDKTIIVLEGLAGKPLKEVCREYRITEFQYRRWRKHFLLHSPRVFDWDFEDLCRNRAIMRPAIGKAEMKAAWHLEPDPANS